jgi:FkbM family methyltransferase
MKNSGVFQKLSWRVELLQKAILSGRMADWKGVLREVVSSHRGNLLSPLAPSPVLLREEGGLGFYQVADKKIYFPLSFDPRLLGDMYYEIFFQRVYERGECRIRPGDWVVDAGACEGFFSLYALEKGANVLAFEPVPEIAEALEKTLEKYVEAGRAKVYPFGLGREREEKTMFLVKKRVIRSTFSKESLDFWSYDFKDALEERVLRIYSLDHLLKSEPIPPISFLKADVEGSERELLLGARETIRRSKPRLSICTYHLPDDWREIPRMVRSFRMGYRIRFSVLFDHMYGW